MSKNDGGPAFPREVSQATIGAHVYFNDSQKGMSLRTYAAIKLCVPDSGIDWLDEMIVKSQRDKFAGQAMPLIIEKLQVNVIRMLDGSSSEIIGVLIEHNARLAYELADAMLAERERK